MGRRRAQRYTGIVHRPGHQAVSSPVPPSVVSFGWGRSHLSSRYMRNGDDPPKNVKKVFRPTAVLQTTSCQTAAPQGLRHEIERMCFTTFPPCSPYRHGPHAIPRTRIHHICKQFTGSPAECQALRTSIVNGKNRVQFKYTSFEEYPGRVLSEFSLWPRYPYHFMARLCRGRGDTRGCSSPGGPVRINGRPHSNCSTMFYKLPLRNSPVAWFNPHVSPAAKPQGEICYDKWISVLEVSKDIS